MPLVVPFVLYICTWGCFHVLNPRLQSDLLIDHSKHTSFNIHLLTLMDSSTVSEAVQCILLVCSDMDVSVSQGGSFSHLICGHSYLYLYTIL